VRGEYNQNGIKYILGMCDLFIGSRMHSCIAAISQCVPAIGLAYSKKFQGVFELVGMERFVADVCQLEEDEILGIVADAFRQRNETSDHLGRIVPEIKKKVLQIDLT